MMIVVTMMMRMANQLAGLPVQWGQEQGWPFERPSWP